MTKAKKQELQAPSESAKLKYIVISSIQEGNKLYVAGDVYEGEYINNLLQINVIRAE